MDKKIKNPLNTAYKIYPLSIEIQKDWKSKDGKNTRSKYQSKVLFGSFGVDES